LLLLRLAIVASVSKCHTSTGTGRHSVVSIFSSSEGTFQRPDQTLRRKGSHWLKQNQFMSLSNRLGDAIGHYKLENPRLGFLSSEGSRMLSTSNKRPPPAQRGACVRVRAATLHKASISNLCRRTRLRHH
jgi:hypothetical protein